MFSIGAAISAFAPALFRRYSGITKSWDDIRYFTPKEFDSGDSDGSGIGTGRTKMSLAFVSILDDVREQLGEPIRILSGYRSPAHNQSVGGVRNSSHTYGIAADIYCPDRGYMASIVPILRQQGFTRIGLYITARGTRFVHCDISASRPQRSWFLEKGSYTTANSFDDGSFS